PPDPAALGAQLAAVLRTLEPLAGRDSPPLLTELHANLKELHARVGQVAPEAARDRLKDFEQRLAGDLAEDMHRLREVSTPAPITVADLPASLRERYLGVSGKWLLRVFGK